jgi:hypothetical protein
MLIYPIRIRRFLFYDILRIAEYKIKLKKTKETNISAAFLKIYSVAI